MDGMLVIFMRVTPDGKLDPQDSYRSDWVGGKGGGPETLLGGDGTPVIGIIGKANSAGRFHGAGVVFEALRPPTDALATLHLRFRRVHSPFLRVLNCSFPRSAWERPSAPLCGACRSVRPVCRAAERPQLRSHAERGNGEKVNTPMTDEHEAGSRESPEAGWSRHRQ